MSELQRHFMYQPGLSRRDSLKIMGAIIAGTSLATMTGCSGADQIVSGRSAHWPDLTLEPITAKGYGTDPNLVIPPESPWPRTMTPEQLEATAILADIIVPAEGGFPSASKVNVPDVIDEWVSAPYSGQQRDRITILHFLAWINDEATLRFETPFLSLAQTQRMQIIDDIAFRDKVNEKVERPARAFSRLRSLVLSAYFCSREGWQDIGYKGNVAIAGDYPGPTEEANAHLNSALQALGLTAYAYTDA
ncbi:gluconate 2-dehydrogenase subunit 3 family protein [Aestuariibacter sp. AA17]|uniref:Gluconate 2-dehydrogenase subunit 3 family protein n=1 Tax=Fluctibacter corallii TaxID=2984329 RepID=A0ABT3AB36_9ALTE|nr:gluconate 2-dehydrogenase subunit 3 family protein [Aestuariibacter sp. AA17]MCV2885511.1 gluconate 2-dehydrogenase subunit 3 family protein [Aestuariibacter sp. AA17]